MPLPGGAADKFGNKYELWWTVFQLLRMLHGKAQSIRIEDPGTEKAEFVVASATRELHQAKRSHHSGKWSIATLASADVGLLQAIAQQLAGNTDRFVFVSTSDARELAELAERASQAESVAEFVQHFVSSQEQLAIYNRLRDAWGNCDDRTAYELLRRIEVRTIDEASLTEQVQLAAQALFLAPPDEVVKELRTIALDSIHKTITRDDLVQHLEKKGYLLRRLTNPSSAAVLVQQATDRYLEGTRQKLIRAKLLPRAETQTLLGKLGKESGDSVLTGTAGSGKTGCVVELVESLRTRDVPVLAFRLDRVEPVSSSRALGQQLDLEESPVLALAEAAAGKEAVLIIDQLDAVSATSGRATAFLEAIEALLREARGVRTRLMLHVVVVCRAFDWENDHRLRGLLPVEHTRIAIGTFSLDETKQLLLDAGYDPSRLGARQLELLRLPQNLALFLDAGFAAAEAPNFRTQKELFDRYWDQKRTAVNARTSPIPDQWKSVIDILTEEMTRTQQLSVALEKLDDVSPAYRNQMVSEGVLTFDGRRYGFGHESFFDYCFARSFLRKSDTLAAFLKASEQHLFRRAQVRQVLVYLRDADLERYCNEVRSLLSDPDVRVHIKDLVLALLARVTEPSEQEWAILGPYCEQFLRDVEAGTVDSGQLASLVWNHLYTSESWFYFLHGKGCVKTWLASSSAAIVNNGINYLNFHQRHAPAIAAELLAPYANAGGEWTNRLRFVMEWANHVTSREFLELFLRLIDNGTLDEARGPIASNSSFWSMLYDIGTDRPEWVPEVIVHRVRRRMKVIQDEGKSLSDADPFDNDSFADEPIDNAVAKAPAAFIAHVLPIVLEVSDATLIQDSEPPRLDRTFYHPIKAHHPTGSSGCLDGLLRSLSAVGADTSFDARATIDDLRRRETYTSNVLLLSLYTAGAQRFADEAVSLLVDEPWRLHCGYSDSGYWIAAQLIGAVFRLCSEENRVRLETTLLAFTPPYERTTDGLKYSGRARHTLLSSISIDLLSDKARRHFQELMRKFPQPERAPSGIRSGWVGPPIPQAAAEKMSDEQWLNALRRYNSSSREHSFEDPFKGGAAELGQLLKSQAEKEPLRFAQLSLRFPEDTNPVYLDDILMALEKAAIPSAVKLDVCRKAYAEHRIECAARVVDVLGGIEDPLPDDAVSMVSWIATEHPEPDHESWQVMAGETPYYRGDMHMNGFNTARGRGALAIQSLILKDSAYVTRFRDTLERIVKDKSASVLSCVGWALQAVGYHDDALAFSLFEKIEIADDRLLATEPISGLIWRGLRKHFDTLRPNIERMMRSAHSDVRQTGARLVAIAAFYHEAAKSLEAEMAQGDAFQKLGVAEVAVANLGETDCRAWCEERLKAFFNDTEEDVRKEAASCFRHLSAPSLESYSDLIAAFIESAAFNDDSHSLLYALEHTRQGLPGMVCDVCQKFLDRFAGEAKDTRQRRAGDSRTISRLIFRTYQQHQSDEWTKRALDLIDRLCREAISDAKSEFEDFER